MKMNKLDLPKISEIHSLSENPTENKIDSIDKTKTFKSNK